MSISMQWGRPLSKTLLTPRKAICFLVFAGLIGAPLVSMAQPKPKQPTVPSQPPARLENKKCAGCHDMDKKRFSRSSHGKQLCVSCHTDVAFKGDEHQDTLKKVECGSCHKTQDAVFKKSLHGVALLKGDKFAPRCWNCHGKHDILPAKDPASHAFVMNIPHVCSTCHIEGAPMTKVHSLSKKGVIKEYSMSIHSKGLYKRGLTVSAVCSSCHGSHDIRRHTDPQSSIHPKQLAKTCTKCHGQIERVHTKIIRGELWEKKPGDIPSCANCHPPHQVQRVVYQQDLPDKSCIGCHQKKELTTKRKDKLVSLFVDEKKLRGSAHAKIPCIKCHTEARTTNNPPCKKIAKVNCANCHAQQGKDFDISIHGQLLKKNDPDAPTCKSCHGTHEVIPKIRVDSPIFPRNVPRLCGECHRDGQKASLHRKKKDHFVKNYVESVHGKGLIASGLLVTATCTDCHSSHRELPKSDPRSTVHPKNQIKTCARCHHGINEKLKTSIHSPLVNKTKKRLPTCSDCHQSHTISRVDSSVFRRKTLDQCGQCHKEVTKTYFDTLHGKVSKLGEKVAAKCSDCHGSHEILPPTNPKSKLSHWNIVKTCAQCHKNANRKFAGYLTHATHHNKEKYPVLYYAFWFMTILLVSTLGFFAVHTLMWMPRSIHEWTLRRKEAKARKATGATVVYYRRFTVYQSVMHVMVIVSFLFLAMTGMILKFPDFGAFRSLSAAFGGYRVTGFIHRLCALVTFGYFAMHLGHVFWMWRAKKLSIKQLFVGEHTMLPRWRDAIEFGQTIKWFVGLGPKPTYGRWTYWEKFDYLAVFWGVAIIGMSGLVLWFPTFFTRVVPGWVINLATVIHSDEALLATGFIFTVHFFNTHFRADRLPMDPVIFTGRVPLEEMKHERPREYQTMLEEGKLEGRLTGPPSRGVVIAAYVFGLTCLTIGISLIVAIVWAMLFVYT